MKKAIVIVLILVATGAFAIDIDGWDWEVLDNNERGWFVLGFYAAQDIMAEQMIYLGMPPAYVEELLFIPWTVQETVDMVTVYYQDRANRKFQVYYVIYFLNDMNFWDYEPAEPYDPASES
jgi:hypothetical protein